MQSGLPNYNYGISNVTNLNPEIDEDLINTRYTIMTNYNCTKKGIKRYKAFIWTMGVLMSVSLISTAVCSFICDYGWPLCINILPSLIFLIVFSPTSTILKAVKATSLGYTKKYILYLSLNWGFGIVSAVTACISAGLYTYYSYEAGDGYLIAKMSALIYVAHIVSVFCCLTLLLEVKLVPGLNYESVESSDSTSSYDNQLGSRLYYPNENNNINNNGINPNQLQMDQLMALVNGLASQAQQQQQQQQQQQPMKVDSPSPLIQTQQQQQAQIQSQAPQESTRLIQI